jgi:hypothetical protein
MPQFATDTDLLEYEPQIKDYGIQDFSELHEKTYDDIIRLLNIKWWPTANYGTYDVSVVGTQTERLSPSKLDSNQFTRLAVFKVLGDWIYPRLSAFDPDGDAFREKMMYYRDKAAEEMDLILQVGVSYDIDSSGSYEDNEKQSFYHGRLIR